MCEEEDPLTPRIRNFESSRRTRMPNNVKTYDGTGDPEDHVKVFQAATQVERWAMPTWCHMFNSTLIGTARDPVEIHNIKQRDGETIEDFMERFKAETGRMKGAPKCMRISGFMRRVNNPELTKRLNEHVPKIMEEMMITTTAFIQGKAAATSKKKGDVSWKAQDQSKRQNSDKRSDFQGHSKEGRGSNRFTPLTRTPKEILAAEASKFQPPPPMVTPVEKRRSNKLCDFHNDKGHCTDECMQLKKQIEELVRARKLSHLIKEIKQGRDQSKTEKETSVKDKPAVIYMVQSWQRTVKQKVTQSFERVKEIAFPPLVASNGTEGPLVIEAEMGGHMIHRMYIDGGSSMEILYEHCFNRHRPEINSQMVPATTSLTGFSSETIWPLGKLRLLVIIGDATHSTRAWMNFMIVKSLSPYNGIIGRPGLRAIQAVPSTVHGMIKFPVEGGIVTIRSTILIPTKCASMITSSVEVAIGGTLSNKGRTDLCFILKKNLDIFAWQPSDMTGVPRSVAEHRLNIREGYSPVWQKKRGQTPERAKDCYPLPEIDWKVESLCGYPFKFFLDAYKGYHQIQLAEADEEKTTFHTGQGAYYYMKMPFGLKNASAIYQRLLDKAFEGQIETQEEPWTLFTDDSSCVDGSGAGLILTSPDGVEFTYALRFQFTTSNNETEYEALVAGLRIAARMGVKNVHVSVDSKLVANQVLGTYVAKKDNMVKYLEILKSLLRALVQTGTSRSAQRQIHKGEGNGNGDRGRRTDLDDTVSGLLKRRSPPRQQEGGKKAPPQGPTIRKLSYMSEEVAASCAGGYGKSKVYKKRLINDNGGSLASSLGTEREYLKIRTTLFSGRQARYGGAKAPLRRERDLYVTKQTKASALGVAWAKV
nr:reverse transcriptase domain-containing protein [Tanacetum cinerariifolium]